MGSQFREKTVSGETFGINLHLKDISDIHQRRIEEVLQSTSALAYELTQVCLTIDLFILFLVHIL